MSVGVFGPPVGYSSMQQTPRFSSMQLEPVNRRRKIGFETDAGVIRLSYRTIRKYLPGLWRLISNSEIHYHPHHGVIDPGLECGLQQPVHQTCITQLFQHLQEMERTDVNSMKLTDWLEGLYKRLLREVDYIRPHSSLSKLTKYFEALGKVLSPRKLGNHRTLFELMSGFFIKYCRDLFRLLKVEDFLKYIYALDRMHQDMRSVLPMMLQPIGREGRRRLLHRSLYENSYFQLLRPTTKRAIWRLNEAKKRHQPLISFRRDADIQGRMLRTRPSTDWKPIPRGLIPKLGGQYGSHPVGYGPSDVVQFRLRPHHRPPHVGDLSGYYTPYSQELTPSEEGYADVDDELLSNSEDYYDSPSDYVLSHFPEFEDYHGYTPRRVSFSGVDEGLLHDIQERSWDIPATPYYDTQLYDDGISGPVHGDRFARRGSC